MRDCEHGLLKRTCLVCFLREENDTLRAQLKDAREALGFYAKTESWDSSVLNEGLVNLSDVYAPWGDAGISVGGKRARAFFAKYPGDA